MPAVSVVMPVHNALPYLDEAIESILGQTFTDFEFVIFDDASTDGSREHLRKWAMRDRRIQLIEAEHNLGPAESSDRVARAARAPLVARMDADDVSSPDRIRKQVELLRERPDVGLVACLSEIIDGHDRKIRGPEYWRLATRAGFVPFAHGTIMYRREVFEKAGGYRAQAEFWEDQDLIGRIAAISNVLVIPRPLYKYRQSVSSTRVASAQDRLEKAVDLMYRCVARAAEGRSYDDLLNAPGAADIKLNPRVFISVGSALLWAGGKPRMFRRMLRRGRLEANFLTLSAVVWAAWASASPGSLRLFLRLLLGLRNSAFPVPGDEPVAWAPWAVEPALSGGHAPDPGLEHEDRPQGLA